MSIWARLLEKPVLVGLGATALGLFGLAAVLLVAFGMPETKAEPPDH